jgi:hypothetical protein
MNETFVAIAKSKEELCSEIIFRTIATPDQPDMAGTFAGTNDRADNKSLFSKLDYFKSMKKKDTTTVIAIEGHKIALLVRTPNKNLHHTMSAMGMTGNMSINTAMTAGLGEKGGEN